MLTGGRWGRDIDVVAASVAVVVILLFAGCVGGPEAPTGDETTVTGVTTAPTTTDQAATEPATAESTTEEPATAEPTTTAPTLTGSVDGGGTEPTDPGGPAGEPGDTNGSLAVHFINVGQAESTLVVAPSGETMLVDTGGFRDDGASVLDYLRRQNVTRIDYLVSSHNDADHIGGLSEILTYYETEAGGVGAVYEQGIAASSLTYADYLDAVERYGVTVYVASAGADIPLAGVNVSVYGPPEGYLANRARNENSVVLELEYGQASVLLTGDAGARAEEYLVDRYGERLYATVLKVGHHGSRTSSTGPFLAAVAPRLAVISSDHDSRYGHPHAEVLDALAAVNVTTFWTATHGTVVLTTDGSGIVVATQRAAPTAPRDLRAGIPVDPEFGGETVVRCVLPLEDGEPGGTDDGERDGVDDGERVSASVPVCGTRGATA